MDLAEEGRRCTLINGAYRTRVLPSKVEYGKKPIKQDALVIKTRRPVPDRSGNVRTGTRAQALRI